MIGKLFHPQSVAIVGAGGDPKSMGGRALWSLLNRQFPGRIYPVNPKRPEIGGLRCYPALSDVPDQVDVVEVLIQTRATIPVLEEAGRKGALAVILLNAGFAEMGADGAALQEELAETARRWGMRVVGPNCGGVFNVRDDIPLGFLPAFDLDSYREGSMAVISQSGGVLTNLLSKIHDRGIGLSYSASTGNEPDLNWLDFLDFMVQDESTRVVAAYAESMPDGSRFLEIAGDALALGKPIVLLKGGSSSAGQIAAASHTAALATSQRMLEAVAQRYGITLVDDVDDLIDVAAYLGSDNQSRGAPVVAVGTSGGMGVMTADALEHQNVPMAAISDETGARLAEALPSFAILNNPIDITGQYFNDQDLFQRTINVLAGASEVGTIMFSFAMITEGYAERFADEIVKVAATIETPITISWAGGSVTDGGVQRLRDAGFPVFRRLGTATLALRSSGEFEAARRHRHRRGGHTAEPDTTKTVVDTAALGNHAAEALLADHGLPVARSGVAHSALEAISIASSLGGQVALKLSADSIRHKSDIGGVRLGVSGPEAISEAFEELTGVLPSGESEAAILVQEMAAPGGLEMIVGLQRDPTYGWFVLVGTGGIYAEAAEDVSLRPAPVDADEAAEMLRELRSYRVLKGMRGRPAYDVAALNDLVSRASRLPAVLGDHAAEVDLNPVLVYESGRGVLCVDVLVVPATDMDAQRQEAR